MTARYAQHFAKSGPTPQKYPIPGREAEQVKNQAGGYVFAISDWSRLDRFLILGSEGNTYYATEQKMTVENAQAVLRCIKEDGPRTVARIIEISDLGRAPKNDPALFALALCAASDDLPTRQAALNALPKVARIGTHLFHFAEYVRAQRGWGRALRRAIGNWYNAQPLDRLVNQVAKYQQRDGWSNRDLLRLSHPETKEPERKAVHDWVCGRKSSDGIPALLRAFDTLVAKPDAELAVESIHGFGLPRECIPTELLNDADVWAALLAEMPMTAMIRNLGKMSAVGLLKPLGRDNAKVIDAFKNAETIRKSRLHPFAILLALKVYGQGRGEKGSLTWQAVPQIVDALDDAFYLAFQNVEPTGKRILIGVDVSASMSSAFMNSPLAVNEGAAALAMTVARAESNYHICAFDQGMRELPISAKSRLRDVLKLTKDINSGGTDCALPMIYADQHGLEVDAFLVLTDNETWAGRVHPAQALQAYRRKTGINAKLIVCGMTATQFSIADPKDDGMLDCVGFDTATPQIISDFIRN
jgi:60 kDa SS-A/Ro ribonucleoprotein